MNNQKPENKKNDIINKEKRELPPKEKINKSQKSGLYTALGVCLFSVAAAALITYMGFTDFDNEVSRTPVVSNSYSVKDSAELNDDPLIDGKRNENSSALENKEKEPENSAGELSDHEGDYETSSVPETSSEAEKPTVEKAEETKDIETDNNIITELIKETAANEAYEVSASFNKPLENYEVIKDYSSDLIYNEKMKDYRTHNGTDVLASEGSKVYAAANGKVKGVYNDLLLGKVVEIEHGEYLVYYCGLKDEVKVNPGDTVNDGDVLGEVGVVPFEDNAESHLHIEVKKNGAYIDPKEIFN